MYICFEGMKELIDDLEKTDNVEHLLDTCFFVNCFKTDKVKKLIEFCEQNNVGMSSFNLEEFSFIHHHFKGHMNHHVRDFFKRKILKCVPVSVSPGNHEAEREYVKKFDEEILRIVTDASDAVVFALSAKINAVLLTKDKHHIFTANAENYLNKYNINVLNEFPHD